MSFKKCAPLDDKPVWIYKKTAYLFFPNMDQDKVSLLGFSCCMKDCSRIRQSVPTCHEQRLRLHTDALLWTYHRASSGTVPAWFGIWPCEKTLRNWVKGLRIRHPEKKIVLKVSQMASCPSDINKKVMLMVCFSCFPDLILK
jgi:hypothetical protein